ncbi:MAG: LacI family DNA-binding transcriptional regulator [Kordiimonas sp.]
MYKKNASSTMQDVAKLAGVSMMTVSRVLRNEVKVKENTKKKVMDAIKKLEYTPNISARSLASSKSHLIAFLYENPSEGYVGQLLIGTMKQAQVRGYSLVLNNLDGTVADVSSALRELLEASRVDGIILTPPFSDSEEILDMLKGGHLPTVRISPQRKDYPFPFVCMDETKAAFDMTKYLIDQGHTKIGFIKGHPDHAGSHLRYDGFVAALKAQGIELPDQYIEQGMFNYQSGFAAAEKLMNLKDRPTAIFAANDDMAAATLSAAQKHHLAVPEAISVVGFDDAPIATSIWPRLTTVRQPILEMAEMATDLLVDELMGKRDLDKPRKNTMDYQLAIRDTVQSL